MKTGEIVHAKITKVFKVKLIVELKNGWSGFVKISNISDYYVSNLPKMFPLNSRHYFLITNVDEENKKVELSWKELMPRYQKDPFDFDLHETKNGFKNLLEKTKKETENA